jgi:hypothetical protein
MKRLKAFAIGLIERTGAGNEQRRMVTIPRYASSVDIGYIRLQKFSESLLLD